MRRPVQVVHTFRRGDLVPSWILDSEPQLTSPGEQRPIVRFCVDGFILDDGDCYFLVPSGLALGKNEKSNGMIECKGGDGRVFAPNRTLIVPYQFHMIAGQTVEFSY